jgi:hypothetical protein
VVWEVGSRLDVVHFYFCNECEIVYTHVCVCVCVCVGLSKHSMGPKPYFVPDFYYFHALGLDFTIYFTVMQFCYLSRAKTLAFNVSKSRG